MADGERDRRELRAALRDFYDDYATCLDEDELERWPGFTADCRYQVISRENHDEGLTHATLYCEGRDMLEDRVVALRQTTVYEPRSLRHLVGGVRILAVDRDAIRAQASFAVFELLSDREPRVFMVGRYLDVVRREGHGFRLHERLCVFDNYRILTSLIMPI